MADYLRRGDSRTLLISDLVDESDDPASFLDGDVVKYTLREGIRTDRVLHLTTADGSIVLDIGQSTGAITVLATDWPTWFIPKVTKNCAYDLELTRGTSVTTLAMGTVEVRPDVTR